jgi:hypothetical protein
MVAIPFSEGCVFVQGSQGSSRIESKPWGCSLGRVPVYGREGVGWQTGWGKQQGRKEEGKGPERTEEGKAGKGTESTEET